MAIAPALEFEPRQPELVTSLQRAKKAETRRWIAAIPVVWPEDRFNAIFRFRRPDRHAPWSFDQVVPVMLQGDKTESI